MQALSFEKWENREKWVNFDGKNGDGDENDDNDNDDDKIMGNENDPWCYLWEQDKVDVSDDDVDWAAYLNHKVKDQGLSRILDPKFKTFSRLFPKQ